LPASHRRTAARSPVVSVAAVASRALAGWGWYTPQWVDLFANRPAGPQRAEQQQREAAPTSTSPGRWS